MTPIRPYAVWGKQSAGKRGKNLKAEKRLENDRQCDTINETISRKGEILVKAMKRRVGS